MVLPLFKRQRPGHSAEDHLPRREDVAGVSGVRHRHDRAAIADDVLGSAAATPLPATCAEAPEFAASRAAAPSETDVQMAA